MKYVNLLSIGSAGALLLMTHQNQAMVNPSVYDTLKIMSGLSSDKLPTEKQYNKDRVLKQALEDKNLAAIENALAQGANANAFNLHPYLTPPEGRIYFSYLSSVSCARIASVLIEAGARVDACALLMRATLATSSAQLVPLYLKQQPQLIHATLARGNILHWLAIAARNYTTTSKLIKKVTALSPHLTNHEMLALLQARDYKGKLPEEYCASYSEEPARILTNYLQHKRLALEKAINGENHE